ncbi:MAG: 50S ribosomal protein L21 [Deltaproteobacteria bacterium]|nr:50S ribosomal protein L21 [Deltaproteobacteria bacterium]
MYAVIQTGGKQYRVEPGRTLRVEKLEGDAGSQISFDNVLLVANGDTINVGAPTVAGAKVTGEILEQGRDKKVIVFHLRRRKAYRRKNGHRQAFTAVKITAIEG